MGLFKEFSRRFSIIKLHVDLSEEKRGKTHEEIVSSTNQETIRGLSSRRSLMSQTISPHEISPATARLADRVIRAGAIYSMAADRKVYRAIALRGEWIVAVSEDPRGLDRLVSADTRVIDEPGLTRLAALRTSLN